MIHQERKSWLTKFVAVTSLTSKDHCHPSRYLKQQPNDHGQAWNHSHAIVDSKHPNRRKIVPHAATIGLKSKILEQCQKRNDKWSVEVETRLSCSMDLVADEGMYHNGEEVYSVVWLKKKLKERYKDSIYFAEIDGVSDVACFKEMASYILNDAWYKERKEDKRTDAERIIETAAKLIMADIREKKYISNYPTDDDIEHPIENMWLPQSLQSSLQILIKSELKQHLNNRALDKVYL